MHLITIFAIALAFLSCTVSAKIVKFTYYWIAFEEDFPAGTDHNLVSCSGGTLAKISKTYWQSLKLECSGLLRSGQYVNGGNSDCSCFNKVSAPLGSRGNNLVPYVSIAANDIAYGTKVLVRQLNGVKLPNGKTHNGCVRVDDVSWSFDANHIDFYVLRKSNYVKLSPSIDGQADITVNANCVIQQY